MPAKATAAPMISKRRGRSLKHNQASRMVKKTCAMMTSDASPTGKPSWIAMNKRPNWPTPIMSP